MRFLDILRPPLVAIDVGTAVTRVSFGAGAVLERPSIVQEAVQGSVVKRAAMRGGVVADVAGVAQVVAKLLEPKRRWRQRPAAVVCAPTDVSPEEREALIEAVAEAGASVVNVVPEPLAAAVGANVDVASEYASAIVDIGDGVTDFAIFRGGAIVRSQAKRIGCSTLRDALQSWLELRHGIAPLPDETVDRVVRAYCAGARGAVLDGIALDREDLEALLDPVIDSIAAFLETSIRELPHALGVELIESGIHVTGGGANLELLVARIERALGLPLTRTVDPLHAVIRGAGAMLQNRRLVSG